MKKKTLFSVALFAFIAGAACQYWFLTTVWPNRHRVYTWVYTLRNYRQPGEPCATDLVLDRQGYSLGYSYKNKSALWVSYILSPGSVKIDFARHGSFYADADIPEAYRVKPDEMVNTGYDKGHLAPSASIDFSAEANRETFALSNVALQEPRLNRQAWGHLESLERKWTETKGKLYIVTGPLYPKKPQKVNDVSVPDRFYKVIYAYDADQAIGFVLPNKPATNAELWEYAMSVQEVEAQTGLTFLSNFQQDAQKRLKENVDVTWWRGESPTRRGKSSK